MNRSVQFSRDAARLEKCGIVMPVAALDWIPDGAEDDFQVALDAQPTLVTQPSAGVPIWLSSFYDPEVVRILQTPNKGEMILGAQKKGTWLDTTMFFPVVENTGEVASYGDFNSAGRSDVNSNFVQRQNYLFQTWIEYGDREVEQAGLARLNWVAEKNQSAAKTLDKFMDFCNHFGVSGLANYGILNDPSLPAAVTPATKAYGGVRWINNGQVAASAQEVYNDFAALYTQLASQAPGYIDEDTSFVFVYPNAVAGALAASNPYGVTVRDYIKKTFPNVEMVSDPRYATPSGNVVQLIAKTYDGAQTGYAAFSEKQRDHRIVADSSSFRQKKTSGTWGAVIRYPLAFAQMLGV